MPDVLGNREKAAVLAYLKAHKGQGLLKHVEEVTSDMWDAYVGAPREVFGSGVILTIDRFHVMKNLQDGLTSARRAIQRELPAAAKARLKGSRWWWVTDPENMRAEDQEPLARLREEFPRLGPLWDQRERLRATFEDDTIGTPIEGRQRLEQWMRDVAKLGLSALDKFCKTLSNWMNESVNYFHSRSSHGRTEGFNHGLRAILWRAYGMFNFKNFRLRVLDRFGGRKV